MLLIETGVHIHCLSSVSKPSRHANLRGTCPTSSEREREGGPGQLEHGGKGHERSALGGRLFCDYVF